MKNIGAYNLLHGILYLYGENIGGFKYLAENSVESVEEICFYCSRFNLKVLHKPNRSIGGFFEIFRVQRLMRKYSVCGSWSEIRQYMENN